MSLVSFMNRLREQFRQYSPPSEAERITLLDHAVFVPDTNVLLHVYRYSRDARNSFFEVLRNVKDRLWIPHQAVSEFHKNRPMVIATQLEIADRLKSVLTVSFKTLAADTEKAFTHPYHPFLDRQVLQKQIYKMAHNLTKYISAAGKTYLAGFSSDPILDELHSILDGRVGNPFSDHELISLYEEAEQRYEAEIPPGYRDKSKPKPDRYGDFVLWKQILAYCKEGRRAAIFVTDEGKDDWILRVSGRTVSIRPELREEFYLATNNPIWIWNSEYFVHQVTEKSGETLKSTVIAEISNNASATARLREVLGTANRVDERTGAQINPDGIAAQSAAEAILRDIPSGSLSGELVRRIVGTSADSLSSDEFVHRGAELPKGPEGTVSKMRELATGPEYIIRRFADSAKGPSKENVHGVNEGANGPKAVLRKIEELAKSAEGIMLELENLIKHSRSPFHESNVGDDQLLN